MKSSCTIVDTSRPTSKLFQPLEGRRFGKLLVVRYAGRTQSGAKLWECVCDCGNATIARAGNLGNGHTTSCGCHGSTIACVANVRHGCSRVLKKTSEYRIWCSMKERCFNTRAKSFPNYGGRGIAVCDRWRDSFENFLADMGVRPPGTSIDRIDNNGNYEPGNCRWATRNQQARNKRNNRIVCLWGVSGVIAEVAEFWGICPSTLQDRYYHNRLHLYGPNPPLPPCNKGL